MIRGMPQFSSVKGVIKPKPLITGTFLISLNGCKRSTALEPKRFIGMTVTVTALL
jgi:hypothetical protein